MGLTFQKEKWSTCVDEILYIWETQHRREVQGVESKALLNVELYSTFDLMDRLYLLTVRDGLSLIGYTISLLLHNTPFLGMFVAHTALYYLLKEYRGSGTGKRMLLVAEDALRKLGVEYIYTATKSSVSFAGLFKHLGWEEHEIMLRKKL